MWEDQKTVRGTVFPTTPMREYGNVSIPQEALIAALRMGRSRMLLSERLPVD
jgi:hypothetical protein